MWRNLNKMLLISMKEDQDLKGRNHQPFTNKFVLTINYDESLLLWTDSTKKKGLRGGIPYIKGR